MGDTAVNRGVRNGGDTVADRGVGSRGWGILFLAGV